MFMLESFWTTSGTRIIRIRKAREIMAEELLLGSGSWVIGMSHLVTQWMRIGNQIVGETETTVLGLI